jgi:hypothetical protein
MKGLSIPEFMASVSPFCVFFLFGSGSGIKNTVIPEAGY